MKYLLLLVFLFVGTSAFAQDNTPECDRFKTGTFLSPRGTIIKRTAEFQTEHHKESGFKIKLKVVWMDECTYVLKFVEANKATAAAIGPGPHSDLTCEIVETGEDFYYHITTDEEDGKVLPKSKLIRID
ncbi:hypothetical protein KFE98_20595 [bacterium SCSIO 12741]|nr:hypothetical protein KFE98_20595 [bacterium SCSIO 12741]